MCSVETCECTTPCVLLLPHPPCATKAGLRCSPTLAALHPPCCSQLALCDRQRPALPTAPIPSVLSISAARNTMGDEHRPALPPPSTHAHGLGPTAASGLTLCDRHRSALPKASLCGGGWQEAPAVSSAEVRARRVGDRPNNPSVQRGVACRHHGKHLKGREALGLEGTGHRCIPTHAASPCSKGVVSPAQAGRQTGTVAAVLKQLAPARHVIPQHWQG